MFQKVKLNLVLLSLPLTIKNNHNGILILIIENSFMLKLSNDLFSVSFVMENNLFEISIF